MDYKGRLLKGSVYITVSSIIAGFLSYLIRVFLARNLSLEDYGLYFSIFSLISLFLLFRDLGIIPTLARSIAKFSAKKEFNKVKTVITAAITIQFIASTLIIFLIFMLADYFNVYFFKRAESVTILKLFAIYIYLSFIAIITKTILLGFQKNKLFSIFEVVKNLGSLILLFFLAFYIKNSYLPLLGYSFGFFFAGLIFIPLVLKIFSFFKYKIVNLSKQVKKIVFFGLPLFLTDLGNKVMGNIDTLMLTYFTNLKLVGVYNVALPSATLFAFLTNGISTLILPMSSELWSKKNKKVLRNLIEEVYKNSLLLVAPVFFAVILHADKLILTLFGQKFLPGTLALQILLVGTFFLFNSDLNNKVIIGLGRPKKVFKITFTSAVLNVILNALLIYKLNIVGAAIATSTSYLLTLILSFKQIRRDIQVRIKKSLWLKTIMILIIVFLVNYGVKTLSLSYNLELITGLILNPLLILGLNIGYLKKLINKFYSSNE